MIRRALALAVAAAAPAHAVDLARKPLDLAYPVTVAAGEAVVVLSLASRARMAGDNAIIWRRYDRAKGELVDGPGVAGFRPTLSATVFTGDKRAPTYVAFSVPPGDYVLASRDINGNERHSFCLGAPVFTLAADQVLFIGDYRISTWSKLADGSEGSPMAYALDLARAKAALAARPELAGRLEAWRPANRATYPCAGQRMFAYDVPGADRVATATP